MHKYKRNRNEYEQWFEMNKNELWVQRYQGNDYKRLITGKMNVRLQKNCRCGKMRGGVLQCG